MVRINPEELEPGLEDYLSDDSDDGLTPKEFAHKLESIEPLVTLQETFENVVIVGGLPKVGKDKIDSLKKVMQLKVSRELLKRKCEFSAASLEIKMDVDDDTAETVGCAILTFENSFEAKHAAQGLNHTQFDKKHVLTACLLDDFDKITARSDRHGNEAAGGMGFTRSGLRWWLKRKEYRGFEQFAARYKEETDIYWHDPVGREPVLIDNGESNRLEGKRVWTNGKVCWSPQGSYFCTFHRPGVALWGGEGFERLARFQHKETKAILFSPNEDYIVTFDGSSHTVQNDKAIQIWRVITQECLRTFRTPASSPSGTNEWPYMLWSYDSTYLAGGIHNDPSAIYIYKTPDLAKVFDLAYELPKPAPRTAAAGTREAATSKPQDQEPVNLKFEWSPTANILSIFIPEKADSPSRLTLVEFPEQVEIGSKNLYNVKEATMHWQSKGLYMALVTTLLRKTGKKGRKEFTQIEIFRMKEKNVPIDTIQIETLKVRQFQWETNGNRLAVLVQDDVTHSQSITFYTVSLAGPNTKRDTSLSCTFEVTSHINYIRWSPLGTNFIAAACGSGDGTLIFASLTDQNKVDVYNRDEHFQVNHITWDSSGRYICTAVCLPLGGGGAAHWRIGRDAGYQIWTFQGRLHHTFSCEEFNIFQWRPRPPSLLSPQKEKEVHKKLKEFSKRYDEIDEKLKREKRELFQQGRKKLWDSFFELVDDARDWHQSHALCEQWADARNLLDESFSFEERETKTEEVIEVRSEVL